MSEPAGDGGLREALAPNCTCDEPIIGGSENRHPNDFRDPECPIHRRKPAAGASTQTPGPAADLIEHAAGIIVESRKQPFTAPGHWAGALWEAGMLVAPGSAHPAAPAVPQPVDREALHRWIRLEIDRAIAFHSATKGNGHHPGQMCDGWSALTEAMQMMHDDAHELLAVLAGEQEQVEK